MFVSTTTALLFLLLRLAVATTLSEDSSNTGLQISENNCQEETTSLHCYNDTRYDTPQNLDVDEIKRYAQALRNWGAPGGVSTQLQTMDPKHAPQCDEWPLGYSNSTIIGYTIHLVGNATSSVSYADIANTIDGGANTTAPYTTGIISCLKNGGRMGVIVNQSDPLYSTLDYYANNYSPDGISIKILNPSTPSIH